MSINVYAMTCDVDPARVDFLVSSHLHFDHCGGHGLIPNARHVVQKREWDAAMQPELAAANHFDPDGGSSRNFTARASVRQLGTVVRVAPVTTGLQGLRSR